MYSIWPDVREMGSYEAPQDAPDGHVLAVQNPATQGRAPEKQPIRHFSVPTFSDFPVGKDPWKSEHEGFCYETAQDRVAGDEKWQNWQNWDSTIEELSRHYPVQAWHSIGKPWKASSHFHRSAVLAKYLIYSVVADILL